MIDMHVHALREPDVQAEMDLVSQADINVVLRDLQKRLQANHVAGAMVYILDERAIPQLTGIPDGLVLSVMLNFRRKKAAEMVRRARKAGFSGIKILTYEQKLSPSDYSAIEKMASAVQDQSMFLTICSTFGSRNPYAHDALALAGHLLTRNFEAPMILAHAGGSRVLDAMLIAEDAPNVFLDTSFTTTFWKGSSVIDNLAYAVERLPDRYFFGSDVPFVGWTRARQDFEGLLSKIPRKIRPKMLHENASNFLRRFKS